MGQEESTMVDDSVPPVTLSERSLAAVAEYIKSGKVKRIVIMAGAGLSTPAGSKFFLVVGHQSRQWANSLPCST